MIRAILLVVPVPLMLVACGDSVPASSEPRPAEPVPVATARVPAVPTPPPTAASRMSLEPEVMALADWKGANLRGELGCGFSRGAGEDGPLLFAASDVDTTMIAEAAIKLDGKVVNLSTDTTGGFDALGKGARFMGPGGLFANVVISGARVRETPQIAEESPRYPAQLVVSQGGLEMGIDGFWECGP